MSGVGLAHADWVASLLVLWLAAGAALAFGRLQARRRRQLLLGAGVRRLPTTRRRDALLLVALLAIAIALAGPRIGTRTVRVPASGIDLVLLVDVSRSMDARDVPPSRLARARAAADRVLRSLEPGDRAALAAFAGRGVLLTPLTSDAGALRELLPALDDSLMSDPGSALRSGVEAALGAFGEAGARPRVLLVLSDGETHRAPPVPAAPLRDAGARVVAVAFGTETGGTLPATGGALRDASGRTVVSVRDLEPLRQIADATGGELLPADEWGEVDEAALLGAVRAEASAAPDGFVERRLPVARFAPFAALALLLLLLELGVPPGVAALVAARRPARGVAAAVAVLALAALAAAPGSPPIEELEARVRENPDDAEALVWLGLARAEAGDTARAEGAFFAAAVRGDAETAALAFYDLGVLALRARDWPRARDLFFDALALAPDDQRAMYNLEWTLRALAGAPPPGPEPTESEDPEPEERAEPEPSEEEADAREEAPAETDRREEPGRAEPARPATPSLDADQARRLLERVRDDPSRALESAARATGPAPSTPPGAPTW